jgi:glycine C-acetyltransferase
LSAGALNHASIIDGIRLCKAKRHRYANGDMDELETRLQDAASARHRPIATDGVFSMDGHIANLEKICELADRYDAMVMLDDSHAVGFLGANGRGSHEHTAVSSSIAFGRSTIRRSEATSMQCRGSRPRTRRLTPDQRALERPLELWCDLLWPE